jgi:hypothetical protein
MMMAVSRIASSFARQLATRIRFWAAGETPTEEGSRESAGMHDVAVSSLQANSTVLLRSHVGAAKAALVEAHRSLVDRAEADVIKARSSVLVGVSAGESHLERCCLGSVRAATVSARQSVEGIAVALDSAHLDGSFVGAVVAPRVHLEGSRPFLVLTWRAEAGWRPLLDWKVALALGAGLGLAIGAFSAWSRRSV